MTRIIAGKYGGRRISIPSDHRVRPTADRVREAIFNLLINGGYGDPVSGARVLDLFAGTGALGLEALSRGAAHATFVDNGPKAHSLLCRNIDLTRSTDRTGIVRRDATSLPENRAAPFTLIFLDPPYGKAMGEAALATAQSGGWLAPEALVVWEETAPPEVPAGLARLDQRSYGDTVVTILRVQE